MKLKKNILLFTLLPLFVLTIGASIVRFQIKHDYLVAYNSECDPVASSCYKECINDDCSEVDYYIKIKKQATDLQSECGDDITGCASANICLPNIDIKCSVTFCDPAVDGEESCDTIPENFTTDKTPVSATLEEASTSNQI